MVVVLGTRTYAAEGKETIDTKKELAFALRAKKDILVLKMTDAYAENFAIMQLPALQSIPWGVDGADDKGGDAGGPPQAAIDHILRRVHVRTTTGARSVRAGAGAEEGAGASEEEQKQSKQDTTPGAEAPAAAAAAEPPTAAAGPGAEEKC